MVFAVEIFGIMMTVFAPDRPEKIPSGDGLAAFDMVLHWGPLDERFKFQWLRVVDCRSNYGLG